MADSKRQRIVAAIVDRMKLINGSGGYATNITNRSYDSPPNIDQESGEIPCVGVYDQAASANPTSTGRTYDIIHVMTVTIRGWVKRGSTASAARALLKDLQKAVRVDEKWTVGGVQLAMQTRQVSEDIIRSPDTFETDGCMLEIEVQFITKKFNAEE